MVRTVRLAIGFVYGVSVGLCLLWAVDPRLVGPVAALAQPLVPVVTPDTTLANVHVALRTVINATRDGNILTITRPGETIADAEFRGWVDPAKPAGAGQGRCVVVLNAQRATVYNTTFVPGDDDALCFVGDTRGSLVFNCDFEIGDRRRFQDKALIGYTYANSSATVGPIYGHADGYAAEFRRCRFKGGLIRLSAGVWQFRNCEFVIGALYAIDLIDARINLVDCVFVEIDKPEDAPYWYGPNGPCPIRVGGANAADRSKSLKSKIYTSGCVIEKRRPDGTVISRRAATAQELCGRWGGPGGNAGVGTVPVSCFRKTPVG